MAATGAGSGSRRARHHPLVAAWCESDAPLPDLLRRLTPPHDPVVAAIARAFFTMEAQGDPAEARRAFETLDLDGVDPALAILAMGAWSGVAEASGRDDQVPALWQRARIWCGPAVPPEVAVGVQFMECRLPEARGDQARLERLLREVVARVAPPSPRHWRGLTTLAIVLAGHGRLQEIAEDLAGLDADARPVVRTALAAVRYIDDVQTGRASSARAREASLGPEAPQLARFRETLPGCRRTLPYLEAALGLAPVPSPPADAAAWERALERLLVGEVEAALAAAHQGVGSAAAADHPLEGHSMAAQMLLRAELAAGNAEAASRLLRARHARGNRLPFDGLFEARLAMLQGEAADARAAFTGALGAVERLDAGGRLAFELALAPELSRGAIAELAWAAPPPQVAHTSARPAVAAPSRPRPAVAGRGLQRLVGASAAMATVRARVREYAAVEAPVLVVGETGTGKEEVARALHEAGPRRRRPFVAINCAAIPEPLIEAELFGHVRGAFTGAVGDGPGVFLAAGDGTLLLDEIGEMPLAQQARLLRAIETREVRPVGARRARAVRCRLVAATNADLERRIAEGRFRADLWYRLRQLEIRLLPLRERPADIVPLARHFLDRDRAPGRTVRCTPGLEAALRARPWRGNARELRAVTERMRLMSSEAAILDVAALDAAFGDAPDAGPASPSAPSRPGRARAPQHAATVLAQGRSPMRRRERLRALFGVHGRLTRVEVTKILGVSGNTATADLQALVTAGAVRKVRPTAAPRSHYFEGTAPGR